MDLSQLKNILSKEPNFRLKQTKQALFCDLIDTWADASTLPLALRQKLEKNCPLSIKAEKFESKDGQTVKAVITLQDGLKIETVLMRHNRRNTVCVSSQAGCPLGCVFCATGRMGFKRNLDRWEIVEQVLFWSRYLKNLLSPKAGKVNNIVFMGMGEPFLNYDNVLGAIRILHEKDGFNLGARHFSISTVGIAGGIQKLAEENLEINLAISLHAPDDSLRSKIMPCNKQYTIGEIFKAVDNYIKKTRRRVMLEYIMIKDVNDSDACAKELAKIAKRPLCFVNLITYNPTGIFEPSDAKRISEFKEILGRAGVVVTQRYRFGQDVKAACGQLAGKQNH